MKGSFTHQANPSMKIEKGGTPAHMTVHEADHVHAPHKPGHSKMMGKFANTKQLRRHSGRK